MVDYTKDKLKTGSYFYSHECVKHNNYNMQNKTLIIKTP